MFGVVGIGGRRSGEALQLLKKQAIRP